jgi:hypothetical protein
VGIDRPLDQVTGTDVDSIKVDLAFILRQISSYLRIEDYREVDNFETGWSDGTPAVQFYRGPDMRVHLSGFADNAAPAFPEDVFTLPVGYRPEASMIFWIGDQEIEVGSDGKVTVNSAPSFSPGTGANLTGISFLGG